MSHYCFVGSLAEVAETAELLGLDRLDAATGTKVLSYIDVGQVIVPVISPVQRSLARQRKIECLRKGRIVVLELKMTQITAASHVHTRSDAGIGNLGSSYR